MFECTGKFCLRTTRIQTKFLEMVEYLLIVDRLEESREKLVEISRKHRLASWIGVAQRPVGIPQIQDLRRVHLDAAITILDVENKLEKGQAGIWKWTELRASINKPQQRVSS